MISNYRRSSAALGTMLAMALAAPSAEAHGWGDRRHHDRVDAGDVLTGVLIVGGVLAIASAASSANRDRRRDDRRDRDGNYPPPRAEAYQSGPPVSWDQGGVGAAVDRCMNEISGGRSRDEVEAVARAGEGWRVQGRTEQGRGFSCTIDGAGRIRNISIEGEG